MENNEITKEGKVNEDYQNIMKAICKKNMDYKSLYPDYYAGAYINDDNELTVLLTEQTDEINSIIKKAAANSDVKIKEASYPLSELENYQNSSVSIYENLYKEKNNKKEDCYDLLEDLTGLYTDEENNKLVAEIRGITEEKKRKFMDMFGESSFVEFEEGDNFTWTAEWKPGRAVYSSDGKLSTGYRCVYNAIDGTQYEGFVTAGHEFARRQHAYRTSVDGRLGVCMKSQFSGLNDVAFIQITDGHYIASDRLYYPDGNGYSIRIRDDEYVSYAARGARIYKVGSTSHWTSGRIISNFHSVFYQGATVSGMLKTTVLNLGGDSGGCAYMKINSHNVAAGTMSGSSYSGNALNDASFICSYISQIKYARILGIDIN